MAVGYPNVLPDHQAMKSFVVKSSDGTTREPGKVSEMILEFAQPLFGLDGGPPDLQSARNIMQMVMLCWNLPVLEAEDRPAAVEMRVAFEQDLARMPDRIKQALMGLVRDRKIKFGGIPFLVLLRIEGTSLENARLIAEARMPGPEGATSRLVC